MALLACSAGMLLAVTFFPQFPSLLFFMLMCLWVGALFISVAGHLRWATILCCITFGACLGVWRYTNNQPDSCFSNFLNKQGEITGIIDDPPQEKGENTQAVLTVSAQKFEGTITSCPFKLLVRTSRHTPFAYGDLVTLEGKVAEPKDSPDFDYKQYLYNKGIVGILDSPKVITHTSDQGNVFLVWLYAINSALERRIGVILPEPQASLLAGLLLGVKRGFSAWWQNAFSVTGTTHIIAISGYNITIIVAALQGVLHSLLPRRKRFYIVVFTILAFLFFIGLQPSAVRAGVMGIYALLAREVGGKRDMTTGIVFSAAVMSLIWPTIVWDIGFQLSFFATIGLVYAVPLLEDTLIGRTIKQITWMGVGENVLTTTAAQVGVFPFLLYHFGTFSLIAPFSNLLVLETIPMTMLLGALAVVSSFLWAPLGALLALITYMPLWYVLSVIGLISNIPFASVSLGAFPLWGLIVYYIVFFGVLWRKGLL